MRPTTLRKGPNQTPSSASRRLRSFKLSIRSSMTSGFSGAQLKLKSSSPSRRAFPATSRRGSHPDLSW
jgi:hypothetical protein